MANIKGGKGNDTLSGTSSSDTINGDGGNDKLYGFGGKDTLQGGAGNDYLDGGTGVDILNGGDGNDILVWDSADFSGGSVSGGSGFDTLLILGGGNVVNLTNLTKTQISGIEAVDLNGSGANTLIVSKDSIGIISSEISTFTGIAKSMVVRLGQDDTVITSDTGWTQQPFVVKSGITYHVFKNGASTLWVENRAPIANPDANTTNEDNTALLSGNVITGSDTDKDGDTLTVSQVNGLATKVGVDVAGAYGTFHINANGSYTYNLNETSATVQALGANQFLTDTMSYQVKDGFNGFATSTLKITITGVNDAAVISGTATETVKEDVTLSATGILTVTDKDGGQSTFLAESGTVAYGTFSMTTGGGWTYNLNNADPNIQKLAAGATLTDSFTIHSFDGTAKVVNITITGTNDIPVITGTAAGSVAEDGTLIATGTLVATDVDTGQSSFQVASGSAAHGTFSITSGGAWTYNLNNADPAIQVLPADATLTDSFTAVSLDGTASKVVNITITGTNDVPVITGTAAGNVTEDGTLIATGTLVATDVDTGQSSFQLASGSAAHGTFSITSGGAWTYNLTNSDPAVQALAAGATLADSFTVHSFDGTAKVVNITINGNNDAPTAQDGSGSFSESNAAAPDMFTLNLLTALNAQDVDTYPVADTLSVTNFIQTSGPTLAFSRVGNQLSIDKTQTALDSLAQGELAVAKFDVMISDGHEGSVTKQLTLNITGTNDAPVAVNDGQVASTDENTGITILGSTLTANDTDVDHNHSLSVASVAGDPHISLANGDVVFTPGTDFDSLAQGETATVNFTYFVKDEFGAVSAAPATASILVTGVNDAPVAVNDGVVATVAEDAGYILSRIALLANDTDVDHNHSLSIASVSGPYVSLSTFGAGQVIFFTPGSDFDSLAQGETATVTFSYVAKDEFGALSNPATASFLVTGVNDAPVAVNDGQVASTDENTGITILGTTLTANDSDVDHGHILSVASVSGDSHISLVNGDVVFTPGTDFNYLNAGETATVTFSYVAKDEFGALSNPATASILVNGVGVPNLPPVAGNDTIETFNISQASGNLLANDSDPDNNAGSLLVTLINGIAVPTTGTADFTGTFGTLTVDSSGLYTYTPDLNNPIIADMRFPGSIMDGFIYQITDGAGGYTSAGITVIIKAYNPPPTINDISLNINETITHQTYTLDVIQTGNAQDDSGLPVTIQDLQFIPDPLHPDITYGTLGVNWDSSHLSLDTGSYGLAKLAAGETADLNFIATVRDNFGATSQSHITLHVTGVDTPPIAEPFINNNLAYAVEDFVDISRDPSISVLDPHLVTDPDSPASSLFISKINGVDVSSTGTTVTSSLNYGTLTMYDDGTFSYILNNSNPAIQALPQAGYAIGWGITYDSFNIQISDGTATTTSTFLVEIHGTNDVAQDITYPLFAPYPASYDPNVTLNNPNDSNDPNINSYQKILIPVWAYIPPGADPDGDPLHLVSAQLYAFAINGVLETPNPLFTITGSTYADQMIVIDKNQAAIQALPANLSYTYTLDLTASDPFGGSFLTRIPVTITGINDAPTASGGAVSYFEFQQGGNSDYITLSSDQIITLINGSDPDRDPLSVSSVTLTPGQNAAYSFQNGVFTMDKTQFNLLDGQQENLSFQVSFHDTHGSSVNSSLALTIIGVTDVHNMFTLAIPGLDASFITSISFDFTPDGINHYTLSNANPIYLNNNLYNIALTPVASYDSADGGTGGTGSNVTPYQSSSGGYLNANGTTGTPGTNGAFMFNLLSVEPNSFVIGANITAGDGGTGGNGYGYPATGSGNVYIDNGLGKAGAGGVGGTGGTDLYTIDASFTSTGVYIIGGDASAGNGGHGGNGGAGDYHFTSRAGAFGTAAQLGPDGGDGGAGGKGGLAGYSIDGGSGNDVIIEGIIGSGGLNGTAGEAGTATTYSVGGSYFGRSIDSINFPGTGGAGGLGGKVTYTISAGAGDDTIVLGKAGLFNATYDSSHNLIGGGSFSSIDGGDGNDTFIMNNVYSLVDQIAGDKTHYGLFGGAGNDTLVLSELIDPHPAPGAVSPYHNIGFDGGTGSNTLQLTGSDALNLKTIEGTLNSPMYFSNIGTVDLGQHNVSMTMDETSAASFTSSSSLFLYGSGSLQLLKNAGDTNGIWELEPLRPEINGTSYKLIDYFPSGHETSDPLFHLYVPEDTGGVSSVNIFGDVTAIYGGGGVL